MKIIDIKTFKVDCFRTNWVFVKVYTDEGIDGVGDLLISRLFTRSPAPLPGAKAREIEGLLSTPDPVIPYFYFTLADASACGGLCLFAMYNYSFLNICNALDFAIPIGNSLFFQVISGFFGESTDQMLTKAQNAAHHSASKSYKNTVFLAKYGAFVWS